MSRHKSCLFTNHTRNGMCDQKVTNSIIDDGWNAQTPKIKDNKENDQTKGYILWI